MSLKAAGYAEDLAALIEALDLKDVTLIGHSTGGGDVTRYIGRHGTKRVVAAVLIAAVPPLLVKTPGNPEGLPIEVFDGLRTSLARDRSAVLQRLCRDVLWRQSARRKRLSGTARPVLAVEHAGRPQELLRQHQGIFRDRLQGPQKNRCAHTGHAW